MGERRTGEDVKITGGRNRPVGRGVGEEEQETYFRRYGRRGVRVVRTKGSVVKGRVPESSLRVRRVTEDLCVGLKSVLMTVKRQCSPFHPLPNKRV